MSKNVGHFIQDAIKKPGSFTALAKKKGGMKKEGGIKESFIEKEKHSKNPTTQKRAVLAQTLRKLNK